jgi:hypothetical protein
VACTVFLLRRGPPEEKAAGHFGYVGRFFTTGMAASSAATRERPSGPTPAEDIEAGAYV